MVLLRASLWWRYGKRELIISQWSPPLASTNSERKSLSGWCRPSGRLAVRLISWTTKITPLARASGRSRLQDVSSTALAAALLMGFPLFGASIKSKAASVGGSLKRGLMLHIIKAAAPLRRLFFCRPFVPSIFFSRRSFRRAPVHSAFASPSSGLSLGSSCLGSRRPVGSTAARAPAGHLFLGMCGASRFFCYLPCLSPFGMPYAPVTMSFLPLYNLSRQ